jgi:hypothetical protein
MFAMVISKAASQTIVLQLVDGERADPDLFDEPPRSAQLHSSCVSNGTATKPCCGNLAFVHVGRGPHAAELKSVTCGRHRETALNFLLETPRLFGAPNEPVILRGTMLPKGTEMRRDERRAVIRPPTWTTDFRFKDEQNEQN